MEVGILLLIGCTSFLPSFLPFIPFFPKAVSLPLWSELVEPLLEPGGKKGGWDKGEGGKAYERRTGWYGRERKKGGEGRKGGKGGGRKEGREVRRKGGREGGREAEKEKERDSQLSQCSLGARLLRISHFLLLALLFPAIMAPG